MDRDRCILAIDLGTSALKVALVSVGGEVLAAEQETCQVTLLPGGGAEQDPWHWWDLITTASSRLMARAAVPAESVVAVACTAQWSGTVPVRRAGPAHPSRNHLDGLAGRTLRAAHHRRRDPGARLRPGQAGPLAAQHGRDTRAERQGPDRAYPVAPARGAGDLPPHAHVPGAQGLAERPAHRTAGRFVRLHRAALADRQPPPGPDPL